MISFGLFDFASVENRTKHTIFILYVWYLFIMCLSLCLRLCVCACVWPVLCVWLKCVYFVYLNDRCIDLICLLFRAIYYRIAIFFVMQILCIVISVPVRLAYTFLHDFIHKCYANDAVNAKYRFAKLFSMVCVSNCEWSECKRSPRDTSHC